MQGVRRGSGLCEHGQQRSKCKECGSCGVVILLEATEVKEYDGEEETHEDARILTVQARVVAG